MIELLGFKRAVLLGVLLLVNAIIGAAFFFMIMPMKEEADRNLASTRSEISRLQNDIQNIKLEMQSLKDTMPQYDALAARGFFLDQDRFYVTRTLEEMKNLSQLSGFAFSIEDLREVKSPEAQKAKKRLIASRIKIDRVISLLDTGFFDFMNVIETSFPAHARIKSFDVKRTGEVNDSVIKRIAEVPGTSLVNASLVMDWLTMVDPLPPPPKKGVP